MPPVAHNPFEAEAKRRGGGYAKSNGSYSDDDEAPDYRGGRDRSSRDKERERDRDVYFENDEDEFEGGRGGRGRDRREKEPRSRGISFHDEENGIDYEEGMYMCVVYIDIYACMLIMVLHLSIINHLPSM